MGFLSDSRKQNRKVRPNQSTNKGNKAETAIVGEWIGVNMWLTP